MKDESFLKNLVEYLFLPMFTLDILLPFPNSLTLNIVDLHFHKEDL